MADLIYRWRRTGLRLVLGLALCVVCAALPTRGFAVFMNGNQLLADCDSKDDEFYLKGYCMAYIAGIADALGGNAINGYRACIPLRATQGQVRDVVVQYLRARPDIRHLAAPGLVAEPLQTAFPCR